jgi:ATPase family associated with various cellular activities (AAA)
VIASHDLFVEEQLRITCERITEAVELAKRESGRADEARWLLACTTREAEATSATSSWAISRMGLSATEQRALWVLIAQELSPNARIKLRDLATEDDVDVSLDVLRRVVYGSRPAQHVWGELSVTGRLRSTCLISAVEGDGVPAHRIAFRVAPRVLALVHGVTALDDELTGIVVPDQAVRRTLDELVVNPKVREQTCAALDRPTGLTIVSGLGASGRRSLLAAAAREIGVEVLTIDARRISQERARADRELRIVARECQLLERVPLLINLEALLGTSDVDDRLDLIEKTFTGRVLATASRPVARRWNAPPTVIELPPLSGTERAALWSRALPEASQGDAELLSTIYPLAPALIDAVGRVAIEDARGAPLEAKHVSVGIRTVLDDRLAGLATRVTVTQKWEDLVLPEDQTLAVVELLARIRARRRVYEDWGFAEKLSKGLGVTALFSGPPGTGKSMCAGLIAKDLGTEIYQVDLGKIVSKWIGETEKNLAALFDAAEAGHAVLLFDEADSLFGKRTAVKSSNDRYANQETNFLLQRIETFAGICILTTNHDPAIDEAFRRRIAVHVRFPLPDEDERAKLWRAMLPSAAPVDDDLELGTLARKYMMGGGNIRNAVLRAAFLAADANENIGNYHLRQAAQLEYEGMGKLAVGRE